MPFLSMLLFGDPVQCSLLTNLGGAQDLAPKVLQRVLPGVLTRFSKKGSTPYPLGAGSAKPNPKMGAPDPENPLFLWLSVLRGRLRPWSQTMVVRGFFRNFSVTPVTDPPGRVPGPKCLCCLGSAHNTLTLTPGHPVGRPPPPPGHSPCRELEKAVP